MKHFLFRYNLLIDCASSRLRSKGHFPNRTFRRENCPPDWSHDCHSRRTLSRDPSFYDDPQRFDGLRFYRSGESGDAGNTQSKQDYTGIEPGNLSWGNGRFTCPGRWYAAAMIKLIVANLLLDYDISFPEGQHQRPQNVKYDTEIHPDFGQKIVVKKRYSS